MSNSITLWSIFVISILHTLSGPDHYLPFIVLSKSKKWNYKTTVFWTFICGIGHIGSSILIGTCAASLGWTMGVVLKIENNRAEIVSLVFIIIGGIYFLWALYKLVKKKSSHTHTNKGEITVWVLFIVFVLGPCEPLIPFMFSSAHLRSIEDLSQIVIVFSVGTFCIMILMVSLGFFGFSFLKHTHFLEKYIHLFSASTIMLCGIGMFFFNW